MADLTTVDLYKEFYAATTLTDAQIGDLISLVSESVQDYLDRDLEAQTRQEWHNSYGENAVVLNEYPVNQIYGVVKGMADYAQLNLTSDTNTIVLTIDDTNQTIDYVLNMTTTGTYDYSSDTITQAVAGLSAALAGSFTITSTINSKYASTPATNLFNIKNVQGGSNMIFDLVGFDFDAQVNWQLEAERLLVLNTGVQTGSNRVMVKYNSGYTLPSGTDTNELPLPIHNVVLNAMKMTEQNTLDTSSYINPQLFLKREKLGDAEYEMGQTGFTWSYLTSIIPEFANQLQRYKRKDVAYY